MASQAPAPNPVNPMDILDAGSVAWFVNCHAQWRLGRMPSGTADAARVYTPARHSSSPQARSTSTENLSATEPAKIMLIHVADDGGQLWVMH